MSDYSDPEQIKKLSTMDPELEAVGLDCERHNPLLLTWLGCSVVAKDYNPKDRLVQRRTYESRASRA